ncbi:hypothetical protein TNCV_2343351 [Trichonephila clavipes]|nr:hypothetical protein TNCV_2343351 [Trichonephila clavipes]
MSSSLDHLIITEILINAAPVMPLGVQSLQNPFLADVYSMKGTNLPNFKSVGLIVLEIS